MELPLIGKSTQGVYPLNYFIEPEMENQRVALVGTPGLIKRYDPSLDESAVRGMHTVGNTLYAVIGNAVYKIAIDFSGVALTGTLGTTIGPVWMEHDATYLMVVDGSNGYTTILTGTTLTEITDADFPTPSSLLYMDGYFIVTEADSRNFHISTLNDPTSWPGDSSFSFTSSEDLLNGIVLNRELIFFRGNIVEPFYNSGDTDFPFERIPDVKIEKGLGAVASPAVLANTMLWLSERGQVLMLGAKYQPEIVSTRAIDREINKYPSFTDAIGYAYEQEGHSFYVLIFPVAGKTWCFDVATRLWHRRPDINNKRHRSNCYAYFGRKHLVGDYENGKIYEFDTETYTDDGGMIRRQHVFPRVDQDRKNIFHSIFEVWFRSGVGLSDGQGSDPQVVLDWSDDDMRTWSNQHWESLGKLGENENRSRWTALGSSRGRNYRMTITDPVDPTCYAPYLEASVGLH